MKYIKVLLTLAVVLALIQAFPVLGQSSGTWIIPPGLPGYITPGYMDSLNLIPPNPMNPPGNHVGQDSIGKIMFWSDIYTQKEHTKVKVTNYLCGEKYWVKLVAQKDTISNTLD